MSAQNNSSADAIVTAEIAIVILAFLFILFSGPTDDEVATVDSSAQEGASFVDAQKAYLDDNATKEGVTVTDSGLQYRVINRSESEERPKARDTVRVHYIGRLTNGEEFDSSYRRGQPLEFPLNRVIPGWTEGVQVMAIGDKYQLTIPYTLAYGEAGAPPVIPPYATLIFDVELVDILGR